MERTYIAIDLKSFYASAECVARGLDPLDTNLVVADPSRTEKTICLAVSPSLKAYGISGRARLFEAVERINEVNRARKIKLKGKEFSAKSYSDHELKADKSLELDYIIAPPRMNYYKKVSTDIYGIYLKYFDEQSIHVYSIDEVFIDVTHYLSTYKMDARKLATKIIKEVLRKTGITATVGIGSNLYLCKIAMDIGAKHVKPDRDGARIAELDEMSYRRLLWGHKPITDFWRIGSGYARRLAEHGMYTMGDVAACAVYNEDLLYKIFGINAELLIDHAFGYEPVTLKEIKAYRPENNSLSSGQVLATPYNYKMARLIIREMTDLLVLDMVEKGLVCEQMVLHIGYDISSTATHKGEIVADRYGRLTPKPSHASVNLPYATASTKIIMDAVTKLYEKTADKELLIRRMFVTANKVKPQDVAAKEKTGEQLNLFEDRAAIDDMLEKEKKIQKATISIRKKYGKNAVLKGMNLQEGATAKERNLQVGGHKG
ncbi:MAG: DNA methylase [Clostridia bacterium]|nr:DNA methylase [Clostridia bacterium]